MEPQTFSFWPSWPLPIAVDVMTSPRHACGYLPGRMSVFRAFEAAQISPEAFENLLNAGFRRSGAIIYQPTCGACRQCVPLRVPVEKFAPTRSQRRVLRKNADVKVRVGLPAATAEKWELYERYQKEWHDGKQAGDPMAFVTFLYRSPVETLEFEYRDDLGKLLGIGLCDVGPHLISSVYFYFDPRETRRSIGTFSALYELMWAREMKLAHWYSGYWVKGCRQMEYKSRFRPCEQLGTDGIWREVIDPPDTNNECPPLAKQGEE